MNYIHVERNDVPSILIPDFYTGRKFKIAVTGNFQIPFDHGAWNGGSRDTFRVVNMTTGESVSLDDTESGMLAMRDPKADRSFTMVPNYAIVRHTIFQGKDVGITIYVHPDSINAIRLPETVHFSEIERIVLIAARSLKSSHNGRDRFVMACNTLRYREGATIPTRVQWEAAKASLIDGGYLNKRGAITTKGKNHAKGDL